MNRKLRRIQPLIQRAEERRDQAARELAARTQSLAEQQRRLQELERFVHEYAELPAGTTVSPAQLANREVFRARLNEALRLQFGQVEHARSRVEEERVRLALAVRKTRVYQALAERYHDEWRQRLEREEHRALDEHALRRARPAPDEEETR